MTNLMTASNQWFKRPEDERFPNSKAAHAKAYQWYTESVESQPIPFRKLHVIDTYDEPFGDLELEGPSGETAKFTDWSFGQLCQRVKMQRDLPARISRGTAANAFNELIEKADNKDAVLLIHQNGGTAVRSMNSEIYTRIWNHEIFQWLMSIEERGWRTPPARPAIPGQHTRRATEEDILPNSQAAALGIKVGDVIADAGTYCSAHDMFAFRVHETLDVDGQALNRGFFVWNSEVGARSLGLDWFIYDAICGNHIVWGAEMLGSIRIRHVGKNGLSYRLSSEMEGTVEEYERTSPDLIVGAVREAKSVKLGEDKEKVVESIDKMKIGINSKLLEEAFDIASMTPRYGNPRSAWAMTQGLTELSQQKYANWADKRTDMDRAAGRILAKINF